MEKSEFKPQAYESISNNGGIEIMLSGDNVYYRFVYGQDDEPEIFESRIEYDDDRAFFSHDDQRYYLDEMMRSN